MTRNMIKMLSLLTAGLLITLSACANSSFSGEPEVRQKESSVSRQESPVIPEEEPADPDNFEVIPLLKELPEYMTNNKTLYAKLLENMLKLYYTGVVTGRVNSETIHFRYAKDVLPGKEFDAAQRKKEACYCKVGGALEYFGYDRNNYLKYFEIYNGCLPYYCYSKDGNIYLSSEISADNLLSMNSFDQPLHFIFRYANFDQIEKDAMSFAAKETDSAVHAYYEGIKNGTVNQTTFRQQFTHDILPDADSTPEECEALAAHATIGGALEYAGLYTPLSVFIDKLGYNQKSDIFTLPDLTNPDVISIRSLNTEIARLHEKNSR